MTKKRYTKRKDIRQKRQDIWQKDELQTAIDDPTTKRLVLDFMAAVQKAKDNAAGLPLSEIDFTGAAQLIAQHPQLASVLDAVRQRQEARDFHPDATYASPTGAYPQAAAINGSKWSIDENEPVGVANSALLRRWADENEWVRAAIGIRRKQVEGMHPVCMPKDPKRKYNKKIMIQIQAVLDQPNEYRDSWRSLIGPILEDVFVLDRGVLLKNMTVKRLPVGLYYENGATIKIYPAWSGNPNEPRYLYVSPDGKTKKALRNDECVVIMDNAATYRYGLSPIQALQNTIVADLHATKAAADLMSMQPPPNAIQIPKSSPKLIQEMAADYAAKIAGRKKLFFFGGPEAAHLFPLVYSAKDQQFLEYQVYLGRKIAILFQLSPQKLGILNDVNRANAEVQDQIDEDRGLIPLLLLVEHFLNREFLADYAPQLPGDRADLDALNLKIVFPEISDVARKKYARETVETAQKAMPGLPSMTLNMILAMLGEEPVEGGDTFYAFSQTAGPIKWLSYEEPLEAMYQNQPKPEPASSSTEDNTEQPSENDGDDAPINTDESTEDNPDGNPQGTQDTKSYLRHDTREAGKAWNPYYNVYTKSKKIPEKARKQTRAPDEEQAKAVLKAHVARMFEEAAAKGKKALSEVKDGEG